VLRLIYLWNGDPDHAIWFESVTIPSLQRRARSIPAQLPAWHEPGPLGIPNTGFAADHFFAWTVRDHGDVAVVQLPFWFLTGTWLVWAVATWLWRWLHPLSGQLICPACQYDLRGSVPARATHCPECGEEIPAVMMEKNTKSDVAG
jgi:hypothetical protein